MCGAFIHTPNKQILEFMDSLNIFTMYQDRGLVRPTNRIQIVIEKDKDHYELSDAIWWLLLKKEGDGFVPHSKYSSFNSNYARLNQSQLSFKPFRHTRCLIPAMSFVESLGKHHVAGDKFHRIATIDQPVMFGGLFKEWETPDGLIRSASIITLAGHPKMQHVHKQSWPLIINTNDEKQVSDWLRRDWFPPDQFQQLMAKPIFNGRIQVTPVGSFTSDRHIGKVKIFESET